MNILSINCNGLGMSYKQNWIRDFVRQEKLSVVGIQETKMELIDLKLLYFLWSSDYVDFVFRRSIGASGGLRNELSDAIRVRHGIWILFGDFNAVRDSPERFISDDTPVILKECHRDFGPRPFRVFDFWYECGGFDDLVNASWYTSSYNGSDDIKLKNKIKNLKADIKRWSFAKRLKDTAKLESLKSVLLNWDSKAERGLLCASDVGTRDKVIAEIHQLEREQQNGLK
ncbi:RNA-directed DNA polymerase, eukaryota [Tanacetum coccineum]